MRGTCFVARRLGVVAVVGLLWISWCVLGGVNFLVFLFFSIFFFERTQPTAGMHLASFNSLLVPGCVTDATIKLVCLSVCLSV